MNIHAITSKVIEVEDISLTAYQAEALLKIISKLPEIEQKALERIGYGANFDTSTIAQHAIQSLKENETFVAVASLSAMSVSDLINILTALATGNEDEFGYWTMIDDEEPAAEQNKDSKKDKNFVEYFLHSKISYGKPTPDHDSYYVDQTGRPYESAYIRLLQDRGVTIEDPEVVWLNPDCRSTIESKLKVQTVIELLRVFDAHSEPDFIYRYGQETNDNIEAFLKFWLGENYAAYAD